jgi:hypothetical protein
MTQTNTISIGKILWKILNNPLASALTYDEAAEFAIEAIRLIGAPVLYESKYATINIESHKGKMPLDVLYIEGVRDLETNSAYRDATDTFHGSDNNRELTELTYKVQKGIIFTSPEVGCIEVAYKGLMVDEAGYPLIVDNEKVKLAIEYYTLHRFLEPVWMMGKITDKAFNYISQERHFYMASAATNLQMPSVDKMESIMNGLNKLITNDTAHQTFFKNYGKKQVIKKY